ncbi:hypothetical protein DU002_12010 [Corallincola holothuriorum]|uniref:Uncharacterized protein n=1 Tax=Corallincola holothuriorum TaxID=2282215 RepID=A0A368NI33_9GAMM|nr:hypothetical protein DU002_12010 [Corallincola holothuriorum]
MQDPQIDYNGSIALRGAEALVHVAPPYSLHEEYTYKLKASYSDCSGIESEAQQVKLGWLYTISLTVTKLGMSFARNNAK